MSAKTAEQRFGVLDFMPIGVLVLDREYRVRFWNACLYSWTGIPAGEIVGTDIRKRFPHLAEPKYAERLAAIFKGGPPAIFSSQLHRYIIPAKLPNSELRLQHTTVSALSRGDAEGCDAIFIIQDVSEAQKRLSEYSLMRDKALAELEERRRAQEAQRDSEEKLLSITDSALDAIVMIDTSDQVVFWNPAAEEMFGYSRDEALGRKMHDLIGGERCVDASRIALSRFGRGGVCGLAGKVHAAEARRRDGTTFPAEICIAGIRRLDTWWAVGTIRDVTDRKKAEARLQELATRDGLTGLMNRRHFLELCEKEVHRARRHRKALSLLMFDVDRFKNVNDTFGHDVGDEVLRALADAARVNLRDFDVIGRIGGEEFAVVLPETSLEGACIVAERLRKAVAAMRVKAGRKALSVTLSIGLAELSEAAPDVNGLMKHADNALYEAKRKGRNRVACAGPAASPEAGRVP
jgi:diguanylate cyclase (GGDEF)-like protein/PAS domain S-box-containing protein